MMNKRSLKLMAWLMTIMMVFNMIPATSFASSVESNDVPTPDLGDPSRITIKYILNHNNAHYSGSWRNVESWKTECEPTIDNHVTPDEESWANYNSQDNAQLIGWSQNQNYNGAADYLFPLGETIDFSKLKGINKDTTSLTLYGVWSDNLDSQKSNEGGSQNQDSDSQGNNQGQQGSSQGSNQVDPYTVRFAINKSYNYLGTEDIPLKINNGQDTVVVSDKSPDDYYTWLTNMGGYKEVIDNYGNYTKDGIESRTFENNVLTVYVKPIVVKFTIHYRRVFTDQNGQTAITNLNNREAGGIRFTNNVYNRSERDNVKYDSSKDVITALSFNIPNSWVEIYKSSEGWSDYNGKIGYYGYSFDQNTQVAGIHRESPIYCDCVEQAGQNANINLVLYYQDGKYDSDDYTDLVILTAASGSKVYDGTALTNSAVTATGLL